MLYVDPANNGYYTSGSWSSLDYDPDNISFTLNRNKVSLDPFEADADISFNLGDNTPRPLADTGKYYAGAISHDPATQTMHVYAMSPVIVLKKPTYFRWTNSSSTYTTGPYTYFKGSDEAITLDFTGSTNPDVAHITNVTYLFINHTATYDMYMHINTTTLAANAQNRWQTAFSPNTQVVDLLYDGMSDDVGIPFNYTLTAVGHSSPEPSTEWSTIAITPGFGISGRAIATTVTVPALNMAQLDPGLYDLYVMGTDEDNNIVAFDQKQVVVYHPTTGVGIYRTTSGWGQWILDYNNDGNENKRVYFGDATDLPVVGDWNALGSSGIGLFRTTSGWGQWIFDYSTDGIESERHYFGDATDLPVVGDWNALGSSGIGLFRTTSGYGEWILDYHHDGTEDRRMYFGDATDIPVSGNWTGLANSGIGLYRTTSGYGEWIFDDNLDGLEDRRMYFGEATDIPVVGDWDGDGKDGIGVYRTSSGYGLWILDYNNDGVEDKRFYYGDATDLPKPGNWYSR
jgi:hypothetical protein